MKIIIIGSGEITFLLAKRLVIEDHDITIIDSSLDNLEYIRDRLDVAVIHGYASRLDILIKAEISSTDLLIAMSKMDSVNILACNIARNYNVNLIFALVNELMIYNSLNDKILSSENPKHNQLVPISDNLGIDMILNPSYEISNQVFSLLDSKGFFEQINFKDVDFYIEGFNVFPDSEICNQYIRDISKIKDLQEVLILSIIRNGELLFPKGNMKILEKDKVYFIVSLTSLERVNNFFLGSSKFNLRKIFIIGISDEVDILCNKFKNNPVLIKVFDSNINTCLEFKRKYSDYTNIDLVHGNYMDLSLLIDEGLEDIDVFISCLENEENNILLSMLAKEHYVKKTISKIEKLDYIPFASRMGTDITINSKILIISEILKKIKKSPSFILLNTFPNRQSEIFAFKILIENKYINLHINKLNLPENVIIVGIIREKTCILPKGTDILKLNDWIIVFTHLSEFNYLSSMFSF